MLVQWPVFMKVQAKIPWGQIGSGLISTPASTVASVSKFVRSRAQFYPKNDQIFKQHQANWWLEFIIQIDPSRRSRWLAIERLTQPHCPLPTNLWPETCQSLFRKNCVAVPRLYYGSIQRIWVDGKPAPLKKIARAIAVTAAILSNNTPNKIVSANTNNSTKYTINTPIK